MIMADQTAQKDLLITRFNSKGYPVNLAKLNGHFLWDTPGSGRCDPNCPCWDDWEKDDQDSKRKKKSKKKTYSPCNHTEAKPPYEPPPPPAPLPIYKKELKWIAKHCKPETFSPNLSPNQDLSKFINQPPLLYNNKILQNILLFLPHNHLNPRTKNPCINILPITLKFPLIL